jgi:hypothetical protein
MIYATLEEIAMSALEDDCMSDDSESGTRASKFNDIMFGRFGHVKCEPMQYTGATDRTHAVKIANEKRALILASDAWGDEKRTRELLGDKPRTEQQH